MDTAVILEKINSFTQWRHKIEVAPGIFTPGQRDPKAKLAHLRMPERLDGRRVLDIGAADGFFTFECERRGASEVVSVDTRPPTGFRIAGDLIGTNAKYVQGSLYELPRTLGEFDMVLLIDVLYHLTDPVEALRRIRNLCSGDLCLTTVCHEDEAPTMRFLPFSDDYASGSNYWSVSPSCLREMVNFCGFDVIDCWTFSDRIGMWARAK